MINFNYWQADFDIYKINFSLRDIALSFYAWKILELIYKRGGI